eukprot:TRINITY_DN35627_c0_g1_i2.p1 TRINITY_DN35627_c0_g1~~TRINITY_DN35627_c0_g1_i2.p1  ORF type:complete len:380 (-),score=33.79 TRINITY_DN35627_c0_g1_i2:74-1051(-)
MQTPAVRLVPLPTKNTKSDLGPCSFEFHEDHIEWEQVQKDWEKLEEKEKQRYGYERDLFRLLESLVREMDRKIAKAQERAALDNIPKELSTEDQARLDDIKNKEKEAQKKAETLAEEGDVDASMMFTQQAESFQAQYDALHKQLTLGDKTMEVCTVCGVFINSTDNDQRREDHLNGKQYQGWKRIRQKVKDLHQLLGKRREKEETEDREYFRRKRDRSYDRYEEGERDRSLSNSSRKVRRQRSPSPRDRDRGRGRDRDRDDYRDRARGLYRDRSRGRDNYGGYGQSYGYGYGYDRREYDSRMFERQIHDKRVFGDRRDYDKRTLG